MCQEALSRCGVADPCSLGYVESTNTQRAPGEAQLRAAAQEKPERMVPRLKMHSGSWRLQQCALYVPMHGVSRMFGMYKSHASAIQKHWVRSPPHFGVVLVPHGSIRYAIDTPVVALPLYICRERRRGERNRRARTARIHPLEPHFA
jgi:hypothetical protein